MSDYLPHPSHGQFDADHEPFLSRHALMCPCRKELRTQHRWSGWPGAWCLDCGEADPAEECLADGCIYINHDSGVVLLCANHPVTYCKYPGSRMFDPYFVKEDE